MSRGVVGLLVSGEVRRSWRSLMGLALIVAVVGTVVLATASGARRTSSVLERTRESTAATDLLLQVDAEPEVVDRVREALEASDAVELLARHRTFPVDGGGEFDLTLHGDVD